MCVLPRGTSPEPEPRGVQPRQENPTACPEKLIDLAIILECRAALHTCSSYISDMVLFVPLLILYCAKKNDII